MASSNCNVSPSAPMNKSDRAQPGMIRCIQTARLKCLLHDVQKNSQNTIQKISIAGQKIPQSFGKRQDPLTHRHLGEDMINPMGGGLRHTPGIARRANTPPFTGIGNEEIITTPGTPRPGKPMSQDTAFQIFTKILLPPILVPVDDRIHCTRQQLWPAVITGSGPAASDQYPGYGRDHEQYQAAVIPAQLAALEQTEEAM